MEREYSQVVVGQLEGEDTPNYEVLGLPEGADFRDRASYTRHTAPWLKINGYAFAAHGFEIGERGHTVTLRQEREGGPVFLETDPEAMDDDGETDDAESGALFEESTG